MLPAPEAEGDAEADSDAEGDAEADPDADATADSDGAGEEGAAFDGAPDAVVGAAEAEAGADVELGLAAADAAGVAVGTPGDGGACSTNVVVGPELLPQPARIIPRPKTRTPNRRPIAHLPSWCRTFRPPLTAYPCT